MTSIEAYHWIAVAVLVLIMACSGCSSARPYTASERVALTHAIIGQSLDAVTTDMFLTDDRMREANGIWWNPEDAGGMLAGKFVLIGVGYLAGEVWPDSRKSIFYIIGGGGYAAATWNTYQMIEHDVNPWGE